VIDMSRCASEEEARRAGLAYEYLKQRVYSFVAGKAKTATTSHYTNWLRTWWRPIWPRLEFFAETEQLSRIIVASRHAARPIFVFLSRSLFPTESLQLFAYADDYSFGILQSGFHWTWAVGIGSKIKEDTRYTGEIWETFPWPQEPSEAQVASIAAAARELRVVRGALMRENNWSLRDLYQSAEVPGPHPLNEAQGALDHAVGEAYGIPLGQEIPEFLLELNQLLAEDANAGRTICGPGLPKHVDPNDPRWTSTDCIEPPALES
jgi:hypothetical protein